MDHCSHLKSNSLCLTNIFTESSKEINGHFWRNSFNLHLPFTLQKFNCRPIMYVICKDQNCYFYIISLIVIDVKPYVGLLRFGMFLLYMSLHINSEQLQQGKASMNVKCSFLFVLNVHHVRSFLTSVCLLRHQDCK